MLLTLLRDGRFHVARCCSPCCSRSHPTRGRCCRTVRSSSSPTPSDPIPTSIRAVAGDLRLVLHRARCHRARVPGRHRRRDLSRGVRPRQLPDAVDHGDDPQPRGGAGRDLRRARLHHLSSAGSSSVTGGSSVVAAGVHDGDPRAADRDHHVDGGDPRRAPGSARRAGTASARRAGRSPATTCCAYAAPGILTGTCSSLARALGEAAPLLILGAITGLLPETSLTGKFTAIPMLIYNWSGRPRHARRRHGWTNAAAAAGVDAARAGAVLQRRGDRAAQPVRTPPHRDMSGRSTT